MVQQSWWAHKLLHSAFLPVITQTIAATICLLFQSWNWLWPWGGRFKRQYCISRSRAPDRLPLLHCARNKRGGNGILLVPWIYSACYVLCSLKWILCCQNSSWVFSLQWVCCLFWFCDFTDDINDFFDGSVDAFVLSNFDTVRFAELKLFYWAFYWVANARSLLGGEIVVLFVCLFGTGSFLREFHIRFKCSVLRKAGLILCLHVESC